MERWLPVVGYEGFYEVSDYGQVRSVDRDIQCSNRVTRRRGKILKINVDTHGYLQVCLCDHTKRKTMLVHGLVLTAFVGPCPDGLEARHYPDRNKSNCRLENLSWDTRSQNSKDKIEHGTHNWIASGHIKVA